ncbi:MAG: 30S ribosomal protein S12 methylthiotransferase RimO [Planctomycetes bacterium]|jgi:ribosomal protein S12 methylthiotransferase|nr:30S ribosomal protein S12 methylthiotransferase RimO [Planctomycetota bacterium]
MSDAEHPAVCLVSLGCPKNLVDSERMLARLAEAGCIVGAPMDDADVIIVNTCGFLQASRDEAVDLIGEAVAHKLSGRARRVVVAGCLPTRDGAATRDLVDGIDAILGVHDRRRIVEAVFADQAVTHLSAAPETCEGDAGRFRLTPPHTAYLRIAEGCNQRCSFCTIPAIRGPMRSKPAEAVLAEARELIAGGCRELNVIAQDTTAWGVDLPGEQDLAALLRRLDTLDGATWIRLLYTYPRRFDAALIEAIAGCDHVLPYVDLPLQHIATPVLQRMRRGVTRHDCEQLVDALLDRLDGVALRTSFIVGFPGETDKDFAELLAFVEDGQFDHVGVFEYSPEPGTPAAELTGQVPPDVKAVRAEVVMLAQQQIVFARNAQLAAERQPLEVLTDGLDAGGRCVGRYYGQAPDVDSLCVFTEPRPPGEVLDVEVVDTDNYDLVVAPIDREAVAL